jgi:hypothetical protein
MAEGETRLSPSNNPTARMGITTPLRTPREWDGLPFNPLPLGMQPLAWHSHSTRCGAVRVSVEESEGREA